MKVAVLGGGFIGLTTAYFLAKEGHEVGIIERHSGVAEECSFSNAAQLSYCHAEPWASLGTLKNGIKWLGKSDAPLLFRFRMDYKMWQWILHFLKFCNPRAVEKNTEKILKLGLYSRKILHEIEQDLGFNFDYAKGGKIFLFKKEYEYKNYLKQARLQEKFGSQFEILTKDEVLNYEPALKNNLTDFCGFIRDPLDESADGYKFSLGLAEMLKKMGVKFQFNTEINKIIAENDQIKLVQTNNGEVHADVYVICLGAYSPLVSKTINLHLPIYPIKGYTINFKIKNEAEAPRNSITNYSEKTVYGRVGGSVRVGGTAEFAGYDHAVTEARIEMIKNSVKKYFPNAGDVESATKWACLRPATPDSVPIIGETKFENLYLNTGHGTLGWTQNFASAKLLCDQIQGKTTELNQEFFATNRFI